MEDFLRNFDPYLLAIFFGVVGSSALSIHQLYDGTTGRTIKTIWDVIWHLGYHALFGAIVTFLLYGINVVLDGNNVGAAILGIISGIGSIATFRKFADARSAQNVATIFAETLVDDLEAIADNPDRNQVDSG